MNEFCLDFEISEFQCAHKRSMSLTKHSTSRRVSYVVKSIKELERGDEEKMT